MGLAELGSIKQVLESGASSGAIWQLVQALKEDKTLLRFLSQAAFGLAYIHSRGLVHADIKPGNILVTSHFTPWIADMGLSGLAGALEQGGTPAFCAPEMLADDEALATPADCFGFAMVIWYVSTAAQAEPGQAKEPWTGLTVDQITTRVVEGQRPAFPAEWNKERARFVQVMVQGWAGEPGARMVAAETAEALRMLSEEALPDNVKKALSTSTMAMPAKFPGVWPHLLDARWTKLGVFAKTWELDAASPDAAEQALWEQCCSLCPGLHALGGAKHLTLVHNKARLRSLCGWLATLAARCENGWANSGPFTPTWDQPRFRRYGEHDVMEQSDKQVKERRFVMERLRQYTNRLEGSRLLDELLPSMPGLGHVGVYTVFHCCKDKATALTICSSGFAQLSTLDPGWYGQGLYFSFELDYATTYAKGEAKCVLVCEVAVGNIYPVTEHHERTSSLMGRPPVPKYDAHLVLVKRDGTVCRDEPGGHAMSVTELVLFESSAIFPRCILEL
mmetsp:Transcript_30339/g.61080  ORF Transcript_30339/g.61080 Transcript_30339/m.61080 type:complete len:505 (+) Transcript_30339:3-1517(+)